MKHRSFFLSLLKTKNPHILPPHLYLYPALFPQHQAASTLPCVFIDDLLYTFPVNNAHGSSWSPLFKQYIAFQIHLCYVIHLFMFIAEQGSVVWIDHLFFVLSSWWAFQLFLLCTYHKCWCYEYLHTRFGMCTYWILLCIFPGMGRVRRSDAGSNLLRN